MIKLAIVQANDLGIAKNIETIANFAHKAASCGCNAICFPEAFLTGYNLKTAEVTAIKSDNDAIKTVSNIAQKFSLDILTGFIERSENKLYITHGVFYSDGKTDFYRKTHLGKRECEVFSHGDTLPVFTLNCGIKAAVSLCLESHFNDIIQTLSLKGAKVIFAPHAAPHSAEKRISLWQKIIPARSYDNRVYIACCNICEKETKGGCLVTDPNGDIIGSVSDNEPELLCFEVDKSLLNRLRDNNQNHHFSFYPPLRRKNLFQ